MDLNAQMNAHMNETLNIGGALLVKLFGRSNEERRRFRERAAGVRDIGIQRAVIGSSFLRHAWAGQRGRHGAGLRSRRLVTSSRMHSPSAPSSPSVRISARCTARCKVSRARPSNFQTSMVSFERVFEIIDLPHDIVEKENAIELRDVQGSLEFDNVTFNYQVDESKLLKDVKRYGKMDDVKTVLSGTD